MSSSSDIVVSNEGVRAGGYFITLPAPKQQMRLAFGPPERIRKGHPNHLLLWDSKGMWAFQSKRTGEVTGIGLLFQRGSDVPQDGRPTGLFQRTVSVGKVRVGAGTTAQTLVEAGFSRDDDFEWRYPLEGHQVYIELSQRNGRPAEVEIFAETDEKVSLGLLARLRLAWAVLTRA